MKYEPPQEPYAALAETKYESQNFHWKQLKAKAWNTVTWEYITWQPKQKYCIHFLKNNNKSEVQSNKVKGK